MLNTSPHLHFTLNDNYWKLLIDSILLTLELNKFITLRAELYFIIEIKTSEYLCWGSKIYHSEKRIKPIFLCWSGLFIWWFLYTLVVKQCQLEWWFLTFL